MHIDEQTSLILSLALMILVLGAVVVYYRRKAKGARFPLHANRERRELQAYIERQVRRDPEASLDSIHDFLVVVSKRNLNLSVTRNDSHVQAVLAGHRPVAIRVENGFYRAWFNPAEYGESELYQSPLALVWHVCRWHLTYEDEKRFYHMVRKNRLYEVRDKAVYFHVNVKDHSSLRKIDGVWVHAPRSKNMSAPQKAVNATA